MRLLILLPFLLSFSESRKLTPWQVSRIMDSINRSTRQKGGIYAEYSCKEVSWDDGDRGTVDGELSVWGASITDTRLWEKNGQQLFTVRSDNWNEKLGYVKASEIKLVVDTALYPNHDLKTVPLNEFLKNAGKYGGYAGLTADANLAKLGVDDKVSIRFQTTFLPVEDKQKATLEFATEAYNYNTVNDEDPKNLVVLATPQGIAVQQDGAGAKKLYHHEVDTQGRIHRYWLEAERTKHQVGGPQSETEQERVDAKERGKATAKEIGISAMGKRFNVLMTIQIPLKQKNPTSEFGCPTCGGIFPMASFGGFGPTEYLSVFPDGVPSPEGHVFGPDERKEGVSNAARVSRGSEVDVWEGLSVEEPERHPTQHVTVTVVLYNTIAGGVPKSADVVAAIDDMENLYKACNWSGNLKDKEANFMKTELNNQEMSKIWEKLITQPYTSGALPIGPAVPLKIG